MKIYRDNGQNSLDRINEIQSKLGYSFPLSFIDLMKSHDALRLDDNIFDFKNFYNRPDERDLNFISFKDNHLDEDILSIQENVNDIDNHGIKDLVVFGICANGDYICFDYRENSESSDPKIVLVYHDDFINHVAENFDDFLNLLSE